MLTFGSLFAGIGGLDLGLERAGMSCMWQVEKDDYAQRVLAKHWPDVARFGDIRDCGAHNLAPVDLICGGFPCQDISNAGKRAGIKGKRSGLWAEFARIICELRPRYVLVENVPALASRGLGQVLGDLAALGYDAEWQCLSAAAFGAPHFRDRLFIIAYPQRGELRDQYRRGGGARWQGQAISRDNGAPEYVAHAERDGWQQGAEVFCGWQSIAAICGEISRGWWAVEPGMGRVAHGVSRRVDRLRGLGNAVVPQVAELLGLWILDFDARIYSNGMRGSALPPGLGG